MTTSLLAAALDYRDRGWSVIPIGRATKKPLIKWADFQRRVATEEEVLLWWRNDPDANIGIITGKVSGIVVVDVDSADGAVRSAIMDAHPTGAEVVTGRGGSHLYYAYPEDVERVYNSVNSGVDIRGDGGYVVAPPSMHHSGNQYRWVSNDAMAPFPESLSREHHGSGSTGSNNRREDGWITTMLEGVSAGGRNDACARLAGYYASKGIPEDIILHTLMQWNLKNDPPLTQQEIRTTVQSVIHTAARRTSSKSRVVESPQYTSPDDPFSLVGLSSFMSRFGASPVSWTIDKWLPSSTIVLMVAPPGNFKTWMLLDLAVSVSTGTSFLGQFPVLNPGPVIVIQQEDYMGQLAERMGTIIESRFGMIANAEQDGDDMVFRTSACPDIPIYLHPDRQFKFSDPVVLEALEQKIAEIRPRIVMIDPLYSAGETDDYMAKTVSQMFPLKTMRDKYGVSFLLAHHTKKSGSGDTERENLWGSQFLNAFLETGWQIRPVTGKESSIKVRRHFKSAENVKDETVKFHIETAGPFIYRVTMGGEDTPSEAAPVAVRDHLLERRIVFILQEREKSLLALKRIVKKDGVEQAVAMLKAEGKVKEGPNGRLSATT